MKESTLSTSVGMMGTYWKLGKRYADAGCDTATCAFADLSMFTGSVESFVLLDDVVLGGNEEFVRRTL
jgi:hypothetical protein